MASYVSITRRGAERAARHPWVFRGDVDEVQASGGDIVEVRDGRGRKVGEAFYSDRSAIALRMLTRGDERASLDLVRRRLARAIDYRAGLGIDATAYRLVSSEADLLPSLIVDRYDQYLVVQTLSQGTDRIAAEIVQMLVELIGPAGILARNDPRTRELEGLARTVEVVAGRVPERVIVAEGDVRYSVDIGHDQKTGLFLDQRENREAAARYASGRLLDCFSYHGGFALRLARHCRAVVAIESSEIASARIRENAALNGIEGLEIRTANVFDELREFDRAGERFDTIVLDPPKFAQSRKAVSSAAAGYKEINLRALKLLRPGGFLVTCTCSHHVDEAAFGEIVWEAAVDAGALVTVVEKRMQARDHPVLLGVPETYYLKCFVIRRAA